MSSTDQFGNHIWGPYLAPANSDQYKPRAACTAAKRLIRPGKQLGKRQGATAESAIAVIQRLMEETGLADGLGAAESPESKVYTSGPPPSVAKVAALSNKSIEQMLGTPHARWCGEQDAKVQGLSTASAVREAPVGCIR